MSKLGNIFDLVFYGFFFLIRHVYIRIFKNTRALKYYRKCYFSTYIQLMMSHRAAIKEDRL